MGKVCRTLDLAEKNYIGLSTSPIVMAEIEACLEKSECEGQQEGADAVDIALKCVAESLAGQLNKRGCNHSVDKLLGSCTPQFGAALSQCQRAALPLYVAVAVLTVTVVGLVVFCVRRGNFL